MLLGCLVIIERLLPWTTPPLNFSTPQLLHTSTTPPLNYSTLQLLHPPGYSATRFLEDDFITSDENFLLQRSELKNMLYTSQSRVLLLLLLFNKYIYQPVYSIIIFIVIIQQIYISASLEYYYYYYYYSTNIYTSQSRVSLSSLLLFNELFLSS